MLRCGENGFLSTPLGASVVVIAALLACGGLAYWARRPGHPDRGPVVVAAATLGVVTGVLNLVLGTIGIWRSRRESSQWAGATRSGWMWCSASRCSGSRWGFMDDCDREPVPAA